MKWVFWAFAIFYAFALAIFLIGAFGLFGQEKDPLSAVFLIPLGFPWIWLSNLAGLPGNAAIGLLSPAINLAILFWLWKR